MSDVYKQSNFLPCFVSHKSFSDSIISPTLAEAQRGDYLRTIEKHYGQKRYAYKIILSPLHGSFGFSSMTHTKQGDTYYATVGPSYESGEFPELYKETLFQDLVIHEFRHSFCNPLIDKFYSRLEKASALLKPILKFQDEKGYGS